MPLSIPSRVYNTSNRLNQVARPDGMVIAYTYDAQGQRMQKSVTPSGSSANVVNDTHKGEFRQYQTNGAGTVLATFTYDSSDIQVSVQAGSDPNTSPRYYYVYNGHGDVVALVDATGNPVASYAYDAFGQLTSASESFGRKTWTNLYRYGDRDGVRYDGETGLYWMSVRAYDPALGRFLSRDPLGRAPLFFADQPYVYAGNDPLINVDPSGQRYTADSGRAPAAASNTRGRIIPSDGSHTSGGANTDLTVCVSGTVYTLGKALSFSYRKQFQQDFFKTYGAGWPWPIGQAEVDFTGYLQGSHRISRSPYWTVVDGGLVSDIWHAAYTHQHGGRGRQGSTIRWLRFIAAPSVATFWIAHNDSIFVHTFDGAGQAALSTETLRERQFINVTLVVLRAVQAVETHHSNTIDDQLFALCNPNTPCLEILAHSYFPPTYPVDYGWFHTWYGVALTRFSCLAPAISGVC